jgi:hypothetical protein
MNSPSNNQPSLKLTTDASKAPEPSRIQQQYARFRDKATSELDRLEKRVKRAHFVVGEIVLSNPEIWAAVKPIIEPRLKDLGPVGQTIEDYPKIVDQIKSIKTLLK